MAQLVETVGVECKDVLTVQGTDQLRLNLSHIIEHLDKMHNQLQITFAKRQFEPFVILLKVIGAFLTSNEREVETADLESHLPSPTSAGNLQQDAHKSIWLSFLENSGVRANPHVELIQHVLSAGGSSFAELLLPS